jgi:lipoprotein associated domain
VPLTVASKCTTTKPVVPAQPETNEGIDKEGFLIKELQDKIKGFYESQFTKSLFASENKDVNLEFYNDLTFALEKPNIIAYNDVEGTLTVKVKGKYKSKPFNEFKLKLDGFKKHNINRFVSVFAKLNLNKMIEEKIK